MIQHFNPVKAFFSLLLFIIISSAAFGQIGAPGQSRVQTYRIAGISVEGNIFADANNIIINSGLQIGDEITFPSEKFATAITRLWNQRLYSDIQIIEDKIIGSQLFLLIRIKEFNRLDSWDFKGLDELDSDDIEKVVTFIKGQMLTPATLKRWEAAIIKRYEKDGYLKAAVTFSEEEISPGRVKLIITVDEGADIIVKQIRFTGNHSFKDDDLISTFKETRQDAWWRIFGGPKFKREEFEKDKDLLSEFYREEGFKDFRIVSDSISFSDKNPRHMFLNIELYEGNKYYVRNVKWVGNKIYSDTLLTQRLDFKRGDVYNQKKLMKNLYQSQEGTDVSSLYYDTGYMFSGIEKVEKVIGSDSLDLVFNVTEGNIVNIGRVHIRGNTKTKEKVLRREIYTLPGYPFSRDAIIRSNRQLAVLNFFDPEKIDIQTPVVDQETVDLVYGVQEKSSDQFNMSAGYSATFGFSGALGLTFTNFSAGGLFNKSDWTPIPSGDAQRLSLDAQFGVQNRFNTFSISFQEPWFNDQPISVGFSIYYTFQDIYYRLIQRGFSFNVGRRLKWPDDYFYANWSFRYQDNEYSSGRYNTGYYLDGRTTQFSVTQVISRNSYDNSLYPRSGSNVSLTTELTGAPFLPGTASYTKHKFVLEGFSRVAGDLVLFQSSRFGAIQTSKPNDVQAVPYQEFFYMGGSGLSAFETIPLRGYSDREVGPNIDGIPIGARSYYKFSAELRYPITLSPQASVYVLGFFDAGNTWRKFSEASLFDLKRSIGGGVRIFLPFVGMIGLDYGYGLDPTLSRRNPTGWNLTFTFGQGQ